MYGQYQRASDWRVVIVALDSDKKYRTKVEVEPKAKAQTDRVKRGPAVGVAAVDVGSRVEQRHQTLGVSQPGGLDRWGGMVEADLASTHPGSRR